MMLSFLAAVILGNPGSFSSDKLKRPVPPVDFNNYKKVDSFLKNVREFERAAKSAGVFSEDDEEWTHEQFEFFGMRQHMMLMRGGESGQIDPNQYKAAIQHRDAMLPDFNISYIGTSWTFVGPRALDGTSSCQIGPVTGRVNTVCYNPLNASNWWVGGATGGVFKTSDNGSSFAGESDTWDYTYCSDIAVDPNDGNRVYVATGDYPGWWGYGLGIMRTSNGTSWTNELTTELQGCEVSDILIDPDDSSTILVTAGRGTDNNSGKGIWRSADYGNTWTRVASTTVSNGFSKLTAGIRVSNKRYIYASTGDGGILKRSQDGGATWVDASPSTVFDFGAVAASKTSRDVVYYYSSSGTILMSKDAGANWSSIKGNLGNITDVNSDFRQTTYNYLFDVINTSPDGTGSDILIFGAVDCFALLNPIGGNTTWSWINGSPGTLRNVHADYHGFSQHPTVKSAALISNDGGVWQLLYLSGTGFLWTSMNSALRLTEHVFTAPHPDASNNPNYLNTGMWHLGCGWSPNNVNDWRSNYGGDGMWTAIDDSNPNIQYVSSQNLGAGGTISLRGTTTSWVSSSNLSTSTSLNPENWAFCGSWSEIPGDTGALYMAGERLYKLKWTGAAATWTKSIGGADFSAASNEYATAIRAVSGGGCFVGTWYGRLYGSLTPSTGVPLIHDFVGPISSISASPTDSDDLLVSIGGVESGGPNGSGALWEVLDATGGSPSFTDRTGMGTNSLPDIGINWVERDPYDPTFTWYVATDVGVYYTRDRGANWYNISEPLGLPNTLVYQLEVSDGYLYASTFGRGVWRMTLNSAAPTLTAFTFQNTEVTGGNSAPATMTLSRVAPPGGLDVPVTSNNLSVIPTQLVHFPAGETTATVYVSTNIVTGDSTVTATANYGGPKSDSIIVRECSVSDMTLSNVTSGNGFVGIVYIDRPAPGGGLNINLVSNNTGGTTVQTPVTILSGATAAFFNVSTTMVPSDLVVGIQASGPGSGIQKSFTKYGVHVTNVLGIVNIVWNTLPATISATLNRAAPTAGFKFQVSSSNPAVLQVPSTFTIPSGLSSSNLTMTTSYVDTDTDVTVTLTDPFGGHYQQLITVRHLGVQGLTFNPNPVTGGNTSTGTVTLDRNVGIIGFTVNLSSLYPAFAQVPATMTVPANQTSGTFQATTFGTSVVNDVPITAVIGNQLVPGAYQTTNLRLLPSQIIVAPSTFVANFGQVTSGSVGSLASVDSNSLRVCKAFVPNLIVYPVTVQVDGVAPIASCTGIKFRVNSRMANGGSFIQTLETWNWTTGSWDPTDTRTDSMSTSFVSRELLGTGTLSRWLRSDGSLRARYKAKLNGFSAVVVWCHETDESVWVVTP